MKLKRCKFIVRDNHIYIANRWGNARRYDESVIFQERHPLELISGIEELSKKSQVAGKVYDGVMVVAILEKTHSGEFEIPFQGKYRKDIRDPALQKQYLAGSGT